MCKNVEDMGKNLVNPSIIARITACTNVIWKEIISVCNNKIQSLYYIALLVSPFLK